MLFMRRTTKTKARNRKHRQKKRRRLDKLRKKHEAATKIQMVFRKWMKNQKSIKLRRELREAKAVLARLQLQKQEKEKQEKEKQEKEKQEWIRRKEENRWMRLDRRKRSLQKEGKQPWTNSTGLRHGPILREKKKIDWTPVNDWNKEFYQVVFTNRPKTITWDPQLSN